MLNHEQQSLRPDNKVVESFLPVIGSNFMAKRKRTASPAKLKSGSKPGWHSEPGAVLRNWLTVPDVPSPMLVCSGPKKLDRNQARFRDSVGCGRVSNQAASNS